MKLLFLYGVSPRCGTNHLNHMISLHPDVTFPRYLQEDEFASEMSTLVDMADRLDLRWRFNLERQERDATVPTGSDVCEALGKAMTDLYIKQPTYHTNRSFLLLKSPKPFGIEHIHRFFPDACPIVLIRDGKSVVESSLRSFGESFEYNVDVFNQYAHALRSAVDYWKYHGLKFLCVRYEALVNDRNTTIRQALEACGLDSSKYDFAHHEDDKVMGSCETRKDNRWVWQISEKHENFNPLERSSHWSCGQILHYKEVCGWYDRYFGY